jgi:hypothetical protein
LKFDEKFFYELEDKGKVVKKARKREVIVIGILNDREPLLQF